MRIKILLILSLLFSQTLDAKIADVDFFEAPSTRHALISPNGKLIAVINDEKENSQLSLITTNNFAKKTILNLSEFANGESYIGQFAWVDNRNLAVQFLEKVKGVDRLLETRFKRNLLIIRIPDKAGDKPTIKSVRTSGWIVNTVKDVTDSFYYAKSGSYSQVYDIKPSKLLEHKARMNKLTKKDGGQFKKDNEVVSIKGYALRWFFKPDNSVAAVLNYNTDAELALQTFDKDKNLTKLKSWKFDKDEDEEDEFRFIPIALAEEENTFYCLDSKAQEKRIIYKVNYADNTHKVFYESNEYEINSLIQKSGSTYPIGVQILKDGDVENVYFDKDKKESEQFSKKQNHRSVTLSESTTGAMIVFDESYNVPGQFFYKRSAKSKLKKIGSYFPKLDNKIKSRQVEETVKVDELDIPYILNLPKNNKKQHPLIVMPHGGPIGVFDTRYFDQETQYLNHKGFAVLRINYRGSSGYSIELKNAGKKQWGDLILKDIVAATQKVQKRKDIAANKTCILGSSYGGYAATSLLISNPDLFQCGVTISGVSDVNLQVNTPFKSERQAEWLKEWVGDSDKEYRKLEEISPIFKVKDLTKPIYIIHGEADRVVDVEHAYRLRLMLEKHNKIYEWKVIPEMGHALESPEQGVEIFSSAIKFINKSLQ